MSLKAYKFNTYTPISLILLGWHWYLFPISSGAESGLGSFFVEAYIVAPLGTIWGFSYSLFRKIWIWLGIFTVIGIIPELLFFLKPDWLF
ncbi:hypothetical protein ACFSJQ_17810 [Vibrio olivae]|uniref:Apolipoprotein N-acyltransferase n=1 Tax=Vibrio olivae TaxID=1243002 RepID=A0ABV5HS14_9VIBR